MSRTIIHLDMDSYFASVEQQANPRLRGRPIGVSGKPHNRSIMVAASREAKQAGVASGMPIWEARRLCPEIEIVPGKSARYVTVTKRFLSILKAYTSILEIFSIDEVFMDVTQEAHRYGGPAAMAYSIKEAFRRELGDYITCTIGIAANKTLAKLIVKTRKPDGIAILRDQDVPTLLERTPTGDICGIGRRIESRLAKVGIHSLAELGRTPKWYLKREFGVYGLFLKLVGQGRDPTPVIPYTQVAPVKSVGNSKTIPPRLRSFDTALLVLRGLCDKVGRRLRKLNYVGRTIHLSFRVGLLESHFGKQTTIPLPTDDGETIYQVCLAIHRTMNHRPTTVSQIGVSVSNLSEKRALSGYLLKKDKNRERLNRAVDRIRDLYGEHAIVTGDTFLFNALPEHVGGFTQGEEWEF
jgi:DNA polymerase-4